LVILVVVTLTVGSGHVPYLGRLQIVLS